MIRTTFGANWMASALLLVGGLLSGCGYEPSVGPKPTAVPSSSLPKGEQKNARWHGLAEMCPTLTGDSARSLRAGTIRVRPLDISSMYVAECDYPGAGDHKLYAAVSVYRLGAGGRSVDEEAGIRLAECRQQGRNAWLPVDGVGDGAYVTEFPGKGVRLCLRSSNAVVRLDYSNPKGLDENLADVRSFAADLLAALR